MGQVAFTLQTVVDHLLTVPQVDKARIARHRLLARGQDGAHRGRAR